MLHVDGLGVLALVIEVLVGLSSPRGVDLEAGVARPIVALKSGARCAPRPLVADHLAIRQLGDALLGQVLQVDGAVLRRGGELAVTSSIVALGEVVAFQDPFILNLSKLEKAIFHSPARWKHHALWDNIHIAGKLKSFFGVLSNWSL